MFKRIALSLSDAKRPHRLFSVTIFLSAFLLFQIQPMIARYVLPLFGGSVAVWGTSLVFFTCVLFLGYCYVYFISRFSTRLQGRIHLTLILAALLFVGLMFLVRGSAYPTLGWVSGATSAPALQILLALFACIGVPYFLLSTTGPLLQQWYAHVSGREPYHLYSLSNLGSFLALGTYPFLVEPLLGLHVQQILWSVLFMLCAVSLAVLAIAIQSAQKDTTSSAPPSTVPFARLAAWIALAGLPAAMLVATTARITQVIAPVPFLWVIPLALYLLSFVLAFRGWGKGGLTPFLVLVAAGASYVYIDWTYHSFARQAFSNLTLFFFGSLFCHALLYRLRPSTHECRSVCPPGERL